MANDKILLYGDRWSAAALWSKAVFLLPVWMFFLVPLLGWILSRFGTFAFQAGYPFLLIIGLTYFVDDVLRRKIRIDDTFLHLGFTHYKLSELSSVGLLYSQNGITPASMLLYFGAGRKLALKLERLRYEDFEKLLNLIENRVPHCAIDPVITTLCKSKKLARKAALDESDRTEIRYHSRRVLKDISATFIDTAESWSRLGPSLALVVAMPLWLSVVKAVYSIPLGNFSPEATIGLQEWLTTSMVALETSLTKGIADSTSFIWSMVANPPIALLLTVCLLPVFFQLIKLLFKPNRLVLDATGAHLNLKIGRISLPVDSSNWNQINAAVLSKPKLSAGPDHWLIRLAGADNANKLNLELAALTGEDRVRFSRALEKWAPHCMVDTSLMETLMPRQANSYTELWLQSLAAPPERASLEPLSAGRILHDGRFEVLRRVGVGGQGAAYLCTEHLDTVKHGTKQVVLKETIIPVFVEAEIRKQALERFEQEARILRDLDSDHIVKLLDYFVEDHRGYLVLEWVDGKSLRQMIEDRGSLPEEQVKSLCQQMCSMLKYLHAKGIIHRDFTPDNLILQKDGKLKLIDFNVAQSDEDGTGLIVGKQAYMPAEQFRGKPTSQSDIYAMGATLFYLLTGQDPEPITQSMVRETKPEISDIMDGVIQKCTALDASKRFKSVEDVANAFLSNEVDGCAIQTVEEQADSAVKRADEDDANAFSSTSNGVDGYTIQIVEEEAHSAVKTADEGAVTGERKTINVAERETIKVLEREAMKVDA